MDEAQQSTLVAINLYTYVIRIEIKKNGDVFFLNGLLAEAAKEKFSLFQQARQQCVTCVRCANVCTQSTVNKYVGKANRHFNFY